MLPGQWFSTFCIANHGFKVQSWIFFKINITTVIIRLFESLTYYTRPLLDRRETMGDCSLVRRFCSPKVHKSEIKGSSFRRFCSPKVRKSENEIDSSLTIPKVL